MAGTVVSHLVQFYAGAEPLAESLSTLFAEPLQRGETVVVVAGSEHREALDTALAEAGVNLAAEYKSGRYLPIDAEQALASFMTDTGPDAGLFRSTVGSAVHAARLRTGTVHAYGEMVGLLAARGDLVAALELEGLWDRFLTLHPFRLLCGYPRDILDGASTAFDSIYAAHEAVVVAREPDEPALSASLDLPLNGHAAATGRRAARDILAAWGFADADGLADVAAVVSELLAAACRRGSRRVTLGVGLDGEQVVVSVTDPAAPSQGQASQATFAEAGRSFSVLTTLAQSWGVERGASGSRLWARLSPRRD